MEKTDRRTKVARTSSTAVKKPEADRNSGSSVDDGDVVALKKQIARLEAENKQLRKQIAALTDGMRQSPQPRSDSVREQRHNFFKYSNVRRY
jgi:cell division protein FtsB